MTLRIAKLRSDAPPRSCFRRTKRRRLSSQLACVAAALSIAIAGCGGGIERHPVRGRVLIDDQPLQYGLVMVAPKGARPAMAELDEEGRFELASYEAGDGTVVGSHPVYVNAGEQLDSLRVHWHAPKHYASFATSGLTMDVTADMEEEVVIELTWNGGKPFTESARVSGEE